MTITINNLLKLTLDLSENNINSEEYILLNDLTYNNVLNIYFFLNTLITNQNVTIIINQYDEFNILQQTDTCILNYNNKNLNKNIILTTINTKINITYSFPLNATLIGIFEKKIKDELVINNLDTNPNDVPLKIIHSINANSIISLRVQDGTQFEVVNTNENDFDINDKKVNIANNIIKTNNPSLILDSNTVDISGFKLNINSNPNTKLIITNPTLQINTNNVDITNHTLDIDNVNLYINDSKIDIIQNNLNINEENLNIYDEKIDIIDKIININENILDISGKVININDNKVDINDNNLNITEEKLDLSNQKINISGSKININNVRNDISDEKFDISGIRVNINNPIVSTNTPTLNNTGKLDTTNFVFKNNIINNQILQFYLCGERFGGFSRLISFPLEDTTPNSIILLSSPQPFVIVSNSTLNNYSTSSGLTQVLIYAIDGNYNLVTEVVNLNGTTNVNTSGSYYCVNKMEAYTGNLQNDSYVTCKCNGANGASPVVYSALGIAQMTDVVPTTSPYHAAFNYQTLVMCPANYKMCLKSITMENISISGSNYILAAATGQFSILKFAKKQTAGPTPFIWFKFYSSYIKPYKTNIYTFNTGEIVCMTDATSTIGCFAYLHFDFIPL